MNAEILEALRKYIGMGDTDANLKSRLMDKMNLTGEDADSYLAKAHADINIETMQPAAPEREQPQPSRFQKIADACIARGQCRVLPIEIGGKNPAIKWAANDANAANGVDSRIDSFNTQEWTSVVSEWIKSLAVKFPDLNACIIAKPDEFVFIDCDSYREFIEGYEVFSGEQYPLTYATSARENRTQIHFLQTNATRALGNVRQFKSGDIELSVRQDNYYVLAEGSQHPSGSVYTAIVNAPIVSMPDKMVAYIKHLKHLESVLALNAGDSNAASSKDDGAWVSAAQKLAVIPRNLNGKMVHGSYHGAMLILAGYWRAKGLEAVAIEEKLVDYAKENFEPPIDWTKVKDMALSICNYPEGQNGEILFSSTPDEQPDDSEVIPISLAGDLHKQGKSAEEINIIIQAMVNDAVAKKQASKESDWRSSFSFGR